MNQQLKDLLYIIDENNESDEFYEIWENLENNLSTKIKLNNNEIDYLVSKLSTITEFTDGMYLLSDWIYESGIDYSFVFNVSKEQINHSGWIDLFQDAYFVKHYFMKSDNLPSFSPKLYFKKFVNELDPDKDIDLLEFEYLINVFDFEVDEESSQDDIREFAQKILLFRNYEIFKQTFLQNPNSNYPEYFEAIEDFSRRCK